MKYLPELRRSEYTRPERRVVEHSTPHKHGAGSALTVTITGTPEAVAEMDRAIGALPRLVEAAANVRTRFNEGFMPLTVMDDLFTALAPFDKPATPEPVAAHAAVDDFDDFTF